MAQRAIRTGKRAYRCAAVIAAATSLVLSWMNLAVGIAGDEESPINLCFFGLVAVTGVGALASDGRARGMARTMLCVAALQMILGVIVATGPLAAREPFGPLGLLALNGAFALMWALSGALFAEAARDRPA